MKRNNFICNIAGMRVDAIPDAARQEMEWNKKPPLWLIWWTMNSEHTHRIQLWACEKWNRRRAYEMSSAQISDGVVCFSLLNCNLSFACRVARMIVLLLLDFVRRKTHTAETKWDQVNGNRCPKMKLTNALHGRRLCAQFGFVELRRVATQRIG